MPMTIYMIEIEQTVGAGKQWVPLTLYGHKNAAFINNPIAADKALQSYREKARIGRYRIATYVRAVTEE